MRGMSINTWGPAAWYTLHSFAHASSEKFTRNEREEWRVFLRQFASKLPCAKCQRHFHNFLDRRMSSDCSLTGKSALVSMLNDGHNEVNLRLGKRVFSLQEHYRAYSPAKPVLISADVVVVVLLLVCTGLVGTVLYRRRSGVGGEGR